MLAGEGSYLKIFDADLALTLQVEVFENQTVHGIAVKDGKVANDEIQVVIWGGYDVLFFTAEDFRSYLKSELPATKWNKARTPDWILDVAISPYDASSSVFVTANNVVLKAQFDALSSQIIITELPSPTKSILYSAHLIWESEDKILVAAGTVFGEVIAWSCYVDAEALNGSSELLHTYTGHEGSIFGVAISPSLPRPNGSIGRLIASCSDDRTIRIWDLAAVRQQPESKFTVTRETGFGDNGVSSADLCVATAMGHISRIWRVKFLIEEARPSHVNVLSFGEDSTVQQWSLLMIPDQGSGSKGIVGDLIHCKTYAYHTGKHIWAAAIRQTTKASDMLITGGADGKASQYAVSVVTTVAEPGEHTHPAGDDMLRQRDVDEQEWDVSRVLSSLNIVESYKAVDTPSETGLDDSFKQDDDKSVAVRALKKKKKAKKIPKDAFNRYAFVTDNKLVVTTNFGRVLLLNIGGGGTWTQLSLPSSGEDSLRSWSVVTSAPSLEIAFLAGANGIIYAYNGQDILHEVGRVDGKVADMFIVTNSDYSKSSLIVTNLHGTSFTRFPMQPHDSNTSFKSAEVFHVASSFIISSAAMIQDFLVLGSRYGSLAIFDAQNQRVELEDFANLPTPDAITSIRPLRHAEHENGGTHFMATARDGHYYIYHLIGSSSFPHTADWHYSLSLVHQSSPPFGPMIEQAWYNSSDDLLLYGFKSKNFVAWNQTQQSEIMGVDCGGAHRSYAFQPTRNGGHFLYTKASRLHLHSQSEASHQLVKYGGHGREIKACAVSGDEKYFATGAEDTSIRIWSYVEGTKPTQNQFRCHAVIQKHTTGIQHLQWHGSRYLFSSGGYEEFFIWAVSSLPNDGIGVVCEVTAPYESEDKDLRVMSFDVTAIPKTTAEDVEKLLISLAYSDSTIRVYAYSKSAGYELVANARYTSSCLMQIRCLQISTNAFCLLAAATDGNLVTWLGEFDVGAQELILQMTVKVHQNSIKCLDLAYATSGRFAIVATGGDDNALGISIYPVAGLLDKSSSGCKPRTFILRSAHAAAVTGLTFVPSKYTLPSSRKEYRIASSSNDQRVKEWAITLEEEEKGVDIRIRKTGDIFTPVADVGDVACLRSGRPTASDRDCDGKVLIVGNGMEVWSVGRDD